MNPVLESLFKHQSIRKYKEQPLEDEKLQLIIKLLKLHQLGVMVNKYLL